MAYCITRSLYFWISFPFTAQSPTPSSLAAISLLSVSMSLYLNFCVIIAFFFSDVPTCHFKLQSTNYDLGLGLYTLWFPLLSNLSWISALLKSPLKHNAEHANGNLGVVVIVMKLLICFQNSSETKLMNLLKLSVTAVKTPAAKKIVSVKYIDIIWNLDFSGLTVSITSSIGYHVLQDTQSSGNKTFCLKYQFWKVQGLQWEVLKILNQSRKTLK